MGLDEKSDLDCSQVYQAKDGSINYGDKAKQQAQKEWEDEYDSFGTYNGPCDRAPVPVQMLKKTSS